MTARESPPASAGRRLGREKQPSPYTSPASSKEARSRPCRSKSPDRRFASSEGVAYRATRDRHLLQRRLSGSFLLVPRACNWGRPGRELCLSPALPIRSPSCVPRKDNWRSSGEETMRLSHPGPRHRRWKTILHLSESLRLRETISIPTEATAIDFRASCRPWSIASIGRQDGVSSCFWILSNLAGSIPGTSQFLGVDTTSFRPLLSITTYSPSPCRRPLVQSSHNRIIPCSILVVRRQH